MTLRAGTLDRRITLQRQVDTRDSIGQPLDQWVDVATVWANIRYLNGAESLRSDAPQSSAKASIRIRRRTDVLANMRALQTVRFFAATAISQADPAVITAAGHGLVSGQDVRVDDVVGMTELNGQVCQVERLSDDAFALAGIGSTGYGAYAGGGRIALVTIFNILVPLADEVHREWLDLPCETGANDG